MSTEDLKPKRSRAQYIHDAIASVLGEERAAELVVGYEARSGSRGG